jgi:translation initiation factor RLI1
MKMRASQELFGIASQTSREPFVLAIFCGLGYQECAHVKIREEETRVGEGAMKMGKLLVFEGADEVGKTTLATMLADVLKAVAVGHDESRRLRKSPLRIHRPLHRSAL